MEEDPVQQMLGITNQTLLHVTSKHVQVRWGISYFYFGPLELYTLLQLIVCGTAGVNGVSVALIVVEVLGLVLVERLMKDMGDSHALAVALRQKHAMSRNAQVPYLWQL